jgi:protein involved in polysaccharide export with SLBB domain
MRISPGRKYLFREILTNRKQQRDGILSLARTKLWSLAVFLLWFCAFPLAQPLPSANDDIPDSKSISVTIGGSFFLTGTYPASPSERVDQFLTRIGAKAQKIKPENNNFAKRSIVLKRATKEIQTVDLLKFQATGDYKFNPYLRNEDVLIIPPLNLTFNFVSIGGAVCVPQTMQFADGDRLADAITIAQGIDRAYENVTKASISRLSGDGNSEEQVTVAISENPPLRRGDRVTILADELQRKDYEVVIDGEVNHPGAIPITKDSTTLRKVIEKAGGIKPSADLNRAEVIRGPNVFRSALFSEEFEKFLMLRMSDISYEDSASFSIDNKLRFFRGNGTVDFHKVTNDSFADGDFVVRSGDYIYIPGKTDLVYVFGQVNSPGYVKYKNGEHLIYYLDQAGGVGLTAKSEIYLIKGKTRSWVRVRKDAKNDIEDGDFIWIPKKPIRYFAYYLQQIGTFISIVGGIATVLLLFIQFTK